MDIVGYFLGCITGFFAGFFVLSLLLAKQNQKQQKKPSIVEMPSATAIIKDLEERNENLAKVNNELTKIINELEKIRDEMQIEINHHENGRMIRRSIESSKDIF
ncbi:MAG: hypothetical protein MUC49_02080 [Raineya sp.]|jgi:glutamyl/glutaminyl-tRNA synthetase|nr:hypothetical protein [Raineya sp.]